MLGPPTSPSSRVGVKRPRRLLDESGQSHSSSSTSATATAASATTTRNDNNNNNNTPSRSEANPALSTRPCLLRPWNRSTSKRILLQGPRQSGRTSLAMNLAYTCAANQPIHCHCFLQPCCCTDVVFYRLASSPYTHNNNNNNIHTQQQQQQHSSPSDTCDFPVWCQPMGDGDVLGDISAPVRRSGGAPGGGDGTKQQDDSWDPNILRRIRIQYVTSTRDLLQDLLEMLGKPLREHPICAIVVDDLDIITCGGTTTTTNTEASSLSTTTHHQRWEVNHPRPQQHHFAEMTTRMMQTVAILVDTSHALHRMHDGNSSGGSSSSLPTILVTALDRTKLVLPWMDMGVTLSCGSVSGGRGLGSSNTNHPGAAGGVQRRSKKPRHSNWTASFRKIREDGPKELHDHPIVVDYTFTEHPVDGQAWIEWIARDAS